MFDNREPVLNHTALVCHGPTKLIKELVGATKATVVVSTTPAALFVSSVGMHRSSVLSLS